MTLNLHMRDPLHELWPLDIIDITGGPQIRVSFTVFSNLPFVHRGMFAVALF